MIFQAVHRTPIGIVAKDLERDLAIASAKTDLRRRWVIRTSLALASSSAVLVLLVLLRSDQLAINSVLRSLDGPLSALQTQVNVLGQLPVSLPSNNSTPIGYADTLVREYTKNTTGPVIVATTSLAQPVLRGNGRGVIIYENRRVRRVWLTSQEYEHKLLAQQAAIKSWNEQRRAKAPDLP